jgi:membrane protein required for colicin V production
MTAVDLGLLSVATLSATIGLYRGLLREVLALVIWLVALIAALMLAAPAARTLFANVENGAVGLALGFIVVFVGSLIVGALLQWLVARLVASTGLGGTDRFLGFVFGGVRGVVAVLIALIALRPFVSGHDWWHDSVLIPWLLQFEQEALAFIGAVTEFVSELASGP